MGEYFKISNRFNKSSPSDFGLIACSNDACAIDPKDGSVWHSCASYDFGWGCENGFYRMPIPAFPALFRIVLECDDQEDVFGAAAVILELYPNELLEKLECVFSSTNSNEAKKKLVKVFRLNNGINRNHTQGKHYSEIVADATRWNMIANAAKRLK